MYLFQLVHADIWGPFSSSSIVGAKYFLTIVDDYSRCTWVFSMQVKSEILNFFSIVLIFFIRKLGCNISSISSGVNSLIIQQLKTFIYDDVSQFKSNELKSWFHQHGILHQTSCVYIPQPNGHVKRKHGYLLNVARSLRFQSNLPLHF